MEQDFTNPLVQLWSRASGRKAARCLEGLGNVQSRTAKRWDGAPYQACAPLSYCSVSNSANGPCMASTDNCVKWIGAFVWQIFFRKECAPMDTRARSSEGAGHRSKLSFVTKLDAIEGAQLLRACGKRLRA